MNRLVALDLRAGPHFVEQLRRIWDEGDAAFPVDQRLPPPARDELLTAMAPALVVTETGTVSRSGARAVEPGDALVVATSGSTGRPKGVVLTHDAVAASARASSTRIGVGPDDGWLACLPLAHVGGLSVVTRALVTGTRLIVHPGFEAAAVEAAARGGATLVSLVSTALHRIDPRHFRVIVLGGSRPPDELPANAVSTYGMTETGSGLVYDGRPLDGVEVAVTADGGVRVRGPMLLRAYRDGTDPKDVEGWLDTGDVGAFADDGRLIVEGRRGDLIVTGGEKVWPEPVETIVRGLDSVNDVAVAGVAHPDWGQEVVAFVVPGQGAPTLDEVRARVKEVLPAYCAPRRLVMAARIPRTALGKVRRGELLNLLPRD